MNLKRIAQKGILAVALSSLLPLGAQAETTPEFDWVEAYLTVQEAEVTAGPVETLDINSPYAIVSDCSESEFDSPLATRPNPVSPLDPVEVIIDDIINIGSKIWEIVTAGRPVVNVNMPTAYALPRGTQCWTELESWNPPKSQTFNVAYRNLLGMEVVNFSYRLVYTAGGSYNGAGEYLANVTVFPAEVDVAWGFTFDANVNVGQLVNLGTSSQPEAGMELAVDWKVSTVVKESRTVQNYFIRGNGAMTQLQ